MTGSIKNINLLSALLLFGIPAGLFYISVYYLLPFLHLQIGGHISIAYYISAGVVFVLLFIASIAGATSDGFSGKAILERLRFKPLSKTDWKWTGFGLLGIILSTGIIFWIQRNFIQDFSTSPPFFEMTKLAPEERWTLLIWLAVFFFNIIGEEFFWRGYILPGQERHFGKNAWIFNSLGWLLFHFSFGLNLLIMLLPILIILPYISQKCKNTTPAILIHGFLNGPAFILIALGVI